MDIKIKNRSGGSAVYTIPELGDRRNIRRDFAPGEIKTVSMEEVEALTFVPGGSTLLKEYLQILDEEAMKKLDIEVEPEYNMSESDVKKLLLSGTLNEFLDCLDFAPTGVIDLIKEFSVSLPLNDSQKREAIRSKTGFDVDKALMIERESKTDIVEKEKKERRVQQGGSGRRAELPQYKVTKTL